MKNLHHAAIVEKVLLRNRPFQLTNTKKPVGDGNRQIHQYYEFSRIFTVQGLSSVISREIVSVHPAINGMLDQCVGILNIIVSPRMQTLKHRSRDRIYVIWTQMSGCFPQPQGKTWLPDHFVPLIVNDQIPSCRNTSSLVNVEIPSPNFIQSPLNRSAVAEESITIEPIASPVNESKKHSSPPTTPPSVLSLQEDSILLSDSETQGKPEVELETATCSIESKQNGGPNKNELSGRFLDVE